MTVFLLIYRSLEVTIGGTISTPSYPMRNLMLALIHQRSYFRMLSKLEVMPIMTYHRYQTGAIFPRVFLRV